MGHPFKLMVPEVGPPFILEADDFKRWAIILYSKQMNSRGGPPFWKLMFSTGGPFFKLIISRGGPPFTFKADNFQRWEPLLHWKLIFSRGGPPFQAHYFQRWAPLLYWNLMFSRTGPTFQADYFQRWIPCLYSIVTSWNNFSDSHGMYLLIIFL